MKKQTSAKRDISVFIALILLWIMLSIPTTGDQLYIRLLVSLIFLIPVLYQGKRVLKKIKTTKKFK